MLTNSSVMYIDPFVSQKLTFNGKEFGVSKDRNTKIASRVSYGDLIIHSFKVNASLTESELKTMVEIKMYEEAGLDLQKQYKIIYLRKELEFSDTVLIEALAVEISKTKTTLATVLKSEKYIDFLALPFLCFSTLYRHKILAPKNDLFVYIAENEAFLALYKEGRYISTKSIMNLEDMIKRFKRDEIDISLEELQNLLIQKGLDSKLYHDETMHLFTAVQNIFSEIFTKINDVLMHNRNVFGFDTIDRIFMDTKNARIKGLREFLGAFGFPDTTVHDFKVFKECQSEHLLSCIMASYAYDSMHDDPVRENLTFLVRPPQFWKTQSGKLALISMIALGICGCYPLYLMVHNEQLTSEREALHTQNESIKKSSSRFNAELTKIKNELKNATERKEDQAKALKNIAQSVDELYTMKLSSQTYVDFLLKVNDLLKEYGLMVRSIEQKGSNKMTIEVVAKQDQRDTIAKFMDALIAQGFLGVTTDEVRSDQALYISKIEIAR